MAARLVLVCVQRNSPPQTYDPNDQVTAVTATRVGTNQMAGTTR